MAASHNSNLRSSLLQTIVDEHLYETADFDISKTVYCRLLKENILEVYMLGCKQRDKSCS